MQLCINLSQLIRVPVVALVMDSSMSAMVLCGLHRKLILFQTIFVNCKFGDDLQSHFKLSSSEGTEVTLLKCYDTVAQS